MTVPRRPLACRPGIGLSLRLYSFSKDLISICADSSCQLLPDSQLLVQPQNRGLIGTGTHNAGLNIGSEDLYMHSLISWSLNLSPTP